MFLKRRRRREGREHSLRDFPLPTSAFSNFLFNVFTLFPLLFFFFPLTSLSIFFAFSLSQALMHGMRLSEIPDLH